MKVKIISKNGRIPEYKTKGSAGFDLEACIDEDMVIMPGKRALVPTGIFLELPEGYEAQIRARSGLAIKNGIALINGIGTVDADYRGEFIVPLINLGEEPFFISNGDRIAQVVISKVEQADFELVSELSETERGTGGFGHTGV